MPSVPLLVASLGPLIAALALVVPYFQWQTAHQKVALDLFDGRFQAFEETMSVMRRIRGHARATLDDLAQVQETRGRARFLFGSDVGLFLGNLVGRLLWELVWWCSDPRAPRCPMSRYRNDPLRPLTADERQELTRLSRSPSAPAAQV